MLSQNYQADPIRFPIIIVIIITIILFLTNSTGSAFEELVSAALGTGGMAEDTLALRHKLSAGTRRRGRLASDESDAVDEEQERGGTSHGRLRGNRKQKCGE